MNNSEENLTIPKLSDPIQIATISIWILSSLIGLFGLCLVIRSRTKLKQLEYQILVAFMSFNFLFKTFTIVNFVIYFYEPQIIDNCIFTSACVIWQVIITKQFYTLLYYSLFQVSTLSRSRLFLRLYSLIHNSRHFLGFEIVTTLYSALFLLVSFFQAYFVANKAQRCPSITQVLESLYLVKLLLTSFVPSMLPVLVYVFGTAYVCYSRLIHPRKHLAARPSTDRHETAKFKRNLALLLKFLVLALTLVLSSILQNVFFFVFYGLFVDSPFIVICGILGYVMNALQLGFLVYIHSILKNTFIGDFRRLFSFVYRK